MRDPADTRTLEMPGLETPRRGRGRPRKPDALTPAQRAKAYRARKAWRKSQAARQAQCRYVGPAGETWSGRGKRPRWVEAALSRGYTLDSLDQWAAGRAPDLQGQAIDDGQA